MGFAQTVSVALTHMQCGVCGIQYAVPEGWRSEKQRNGGTWYCPNGHGRVYTETDVQRLQKKLAEANRHSTELAEQVRAAQEAEQRAVDDAKRAAAETKRLRKRVQAGVCTCCNRTFQNLARHMATKHKPDA